METMAFWLPAAALVAVAAILTALGLLRGARLRTDGSDERELGIYKDQLREIERDLLRGLVSPEDAERLRTEIARRLLEADRRRIAEGGPAPKAARVVGLALVPVMIAGAFWVYLSEGALLYPDMPLAQRHAEAAQMRAERPTQSEMEAAWAADPRRAASPEPEPEIAALMDQLRTALEDRPTDLTGFRLLARNEANLGNHTAAARAQERVIALLGAQAGVGDHMLLAESLILAAGGLVSREAEMALENVLRLDPGNLLARYFTGLMFAQTGRPDLTFTLWRRVLEDSPPEAPWVPQIRATIEELSELAGSPFTLPPEAAMGARGPSPADIEAAMGLEAEDRDAMIGAMVEGLAARLASQGGTADDWARLISALGVLGQVDRARAILQEARMVFAANPEALIVLEAAGSGLGRTP
jgi:cytochrome c-type biogenesis protein CcmH